jgi:hypothetical protein
MEVIVVGAPPCVWVELVPPLFWLEPTAVVDMLLAGWSSWTSRISPKVECSEPSVMVEKIWVVGWWRVDGFGWRFRVGHHLDGDTG